MIAGQFIGQEILQVSIGQRLAPGTENWTIEGVRIGRAFGRQRGVVQMLVRNDVAEVSPVTEPELRGIFE
jgi:hypothetical protein